MNRDVAQIIHEVAGGEFNISVVDGELRINVWPHKAKPSGCVSLSEDDLLDLADMLMRKEKRDSEQIQEKQGTPVDFDAVLEALSETKYQNAAQVARTMGVPEELKAVQDLLIEAWLLGLVMRDTGPDDDLVNHYRRYSPAEIDGKRERSL